MNRLFLTGISVICFGASATGAWANIVVNGSFESPTISTSFYENYGANTGDTHYGGPSIPGWVIPTNNVDIVSNLTGWPAPTTDGGHQYLDLVGMGSTGEIYQLLNTVIGQTYQLTLAFGNNAGIGSAEALLTLAGSPGINYLLSHSLSTPSDIGWTTYSTTFVANSISTKLDFLETVGGGNGGVLLDAINVTPVPEPSTWAMMLLGFVGIGSLAYRRRQTRSFRFA